MSSVRMCDRCGTIFSERSEGWSTFTGTTRRKDPATGEWKNMSDSLDSCPECSELLTMPQRPAIATTVSPHYVKETTTDG
jgi:hypothetical protein